EGFEARRAHTALFGQLGNAPDIDCAPGAARLARREADGIAYIVDALAQTVDPAEAQRLVHRLGPGDAGLAGTLLIIPDPQLAGGGVVLLQPGAKGLRRREERG